MTSAETADERVRARLAAGEVPELDEVRELLTQLDEVRAESEARWQAIGQLAPAAKKHRGASWQRARALAAIAEKVRELSAVMARAPVESAQLDDWLQSVRDILASAGAGRDEQGA